MLDALTGLMRGLSPGERSAVASVIRSPRPEPEAGSPQPGPVGRLIVLDSGPLGVIINPRESEAAAECRAWLASRLLAGDRVMVPEIADYEVRRELIRGRRSEALSRLDALAERIGYLSLTTAVMRRAAELWADARDRGKPTAGGQALDGDVILAAQAELAADAGRPVIIATTNVGHLGRYADAREWRDI